MKIQRLISCFDRKTDQLVEEYNLGDVKFEILKAIFRPDFEDPLMYNPYTITKIEAVELTKLIKVEFNLKDFFYQLDCFRV